MKTWIDNRKAGVHKFLDDYIAGQYDEEAEAVIGIAILIIFILIAGFVGHIEFKSL